MGTVTSTLRRRLSRTRPSPAMVIAGVALVLALAGSAVAGTGALKSVLSTKKVKTISKAQASKVLSQREGSLNVKSAKTAADADKLGGVGSSGYVKHGSTIPSGITVTGVFATSDQNGGGGGASATTGVNLPAAAPVGLTSSNVNFAPGIDGSTGDEDSACTGSFANPTAPGGKVCLYATVLSAGANGAVGEDVGGIASRFGFRVTANNAAGAVASAIGVWAYTAP